MTTETKTTKQIVQEFLSLPPGALPSAIYLDDFDVEDLGTPWRQLRQYAYGSVPPLHLGERVLLTADRDGWRDGVVVTLGG